jgi:hypothetical protein
LKNAVVVSYTSGYTPAGSDDFSAATPSMVAGVLGTRSSFTNSARHLVESGTAYRTPSSVTARTAVAS